MAGIEDLKLWRTEPFLETFQEFSPDKKDLGWKYPYQGRWFSPVPYYDWLGPDTIMKELDTKLPFNFYDKAGQIETPGEGFIMKGAKNAADLAKDRAVLQEWFPYKDAGPFDKSKLTFDMKPEWYKWQKKYLDDLKLTKMENASLDFRFTNQLPPPYYQKSMGRLTDQLAGVYGKVRGDQPVIGRYTDNPLVTYPRQLKLNEMLEKYKMPMTEWEKTALYEMSQGKKIPFNEITPPLDIAKQAKINLWESFKQNFMTPKESLLSHNFTKGIYTPKTRWENISRIPIKAKDIYKRVKMGEKVKSGIPWSTIGQRIINNPFTRTAGWLGNVALAGQALSDVYTKTNMIGDMATNINKWAGAKFKDDGTVSHQLNLNSLPIKPKYNMPPKGAAGFNRGGIASLVI